MAFAKRPGQVAEPELRHKPMKPAAPASVAAAVVPAPGEATRSLLDDPDSASPLGTILRVVGLVVLLFAFAAGIALWMKPAEWWEDSALAAPARICVQQSRQCA